MNKTEPLKVWIKPSFDESSLSLKINCRDQTKHGGTPVVPAVWEVEAAGSQVKAQPRQFSEPCLKIKNKKG